MKNISTKLFKIAFINLLLILATNVKSQNNVTIKDTAFARYLREHFPNCMNGDQLDTICAKAPANSTIYLSNSAVKDLTGLQYFTSLTHITIHNVSLTTIPPLNLPNLTELYLAVCDLKTFPVLNTPKLEGLSVQMNQIETLPPLNFSSLQRFSCLGNLLTSLDNLIAPNLLTLDCSGNKLTSLPPLNYPKLNELSCNKNQLTYLPALPSSLCSLECAYNNLTELPELPASLKCFFSCEHNKIKCFPVFPKGLGYIDIDFNEFTCLPNYIASMDASTQSYPLCKNNDPVNNPNNCKSMQGITGYIFSDQNQNCKKESGEAPVRNVLIKLYNNSNVLVKQTTTIANGSYYFVVPTGQYKVKMEVDAIPFEASCKTDTLITVDTSAITENINFGVKCKPTHDIGVRSISTQGIVFPGQPHKLIVSAGDLNDYYGVSCLAAEKGTVEIKVEGPVTYTGNSGVLTPSVNGNVYTYKNVDFSKIDFVKTFILNFYTNTSAVAGDVICVTVQVTSNVADSDNNNNSKKQCYAVRNSMDPNLKEVYPLNDVEIGYGDWFTYTIHFQNTGNAPAINIKLRDKLDPNLDLESFQVLNFSHENKVELDKDELEIVFENIQLADSATNPEGSKGFIQYRILPKANLPEGTIIKNEAGIYFDYNAPIITNTTLNHFKKGASINENAWSKEVVVFPNPGKGQFYLQFGEETLLNNVSIEVYNVLGKIIWSSKQVATITTIDLNNQPGGVYFIKVIGPDKSFNQRLIKQ